MQNRIHITESHFVRLPVRQSREPRMRFVKYYQDLYSLHGEELSQQTFITGSQYSYAELGDSILSTLPGEVLHGIDLLFMVAWAYEYDPDYASSGAYFADQYQITGKIADIGDQGSMGFFTAIDLIDKYLKSSQSKNALVLVMEQTTIPGGKRNAVVPLHDAAFGLLITKNSYTDNSKAKYEIVLSEIKQKDQIKSIDQLILDQCGRHSVPQHKVKLVFKNNSAIHNQYQKSNLNLTDIKTKIIPNYPGTFPLLTYLHDLTEHRDAADFVLMLDEDVETTDIGCLMLRRCE